MHRQILIGCFPYLALIVISVVVLRLLLWLTCVRPDFRQVRHLHRDQAGAVQSLSFVLTLPLFIIILMFIVQLSQLTIAKVAVEYAAFAAARSAIVWLPANLGDGVEAENQIAGGWQTIGQFRDPVGGASFTEYNFSTGSRKYKKIHLAAVMGCLSISPSRDPQPGMQAIATPAPAAPLASLQQVYAALAPASANNTRIPQRLANKLAYAASNTRLTIRIRHREDEPRLQLYPKLCRDTPPFFPGEQFQDGEFGWQDQLVVTVEHDFALLPGPGRILARRADAPVGSDPSSNPSTNVQTGTIRSRGGSLFVYPMSATVRFNNEGERPRMPFVQSADGTRQSYTAMNAGWNVSNPSAYSFSASGQPSLFGDVKWFETVLCRECQPTEGSADEPK